MKPGSKTSEFWISIAPVLVGLIEGMKGDKEIAKWLIGCGTALSVFYIISRTFVKIYSYEEVQWSQGEEKK